MKSVTSKSLLVILAVGLASSPGGSAAPTPTPDPRDWWSLRPLTRPAVPQLPKSGFRIENPVDAFIVASLREKQLAQSPEADARTMIRRLHFDLLGLPPTPREVEDFVQACRASQKSGAPVPTAALESLVDRLLASPHYGERWARHWLDVVHYGDTHGYDKDKLRLNAWPYRDYVVRALNEDKPYARFVLEQVAGDVLFPGTRDGLEALGFLAAGPWDFIGHTELPESKIDGKIARHLDRDDMVANTLGTFNSLTASCAQCHDHKFDPIPQREYYGLQAVFAALDRADRKYFADPALTRSLAKLEHRQRALTDQKRELDQKLAASAGPELAMLDRQIETAGQSTRGDPRPEFGYHSALEKSPDKPKWVQVDLGRTAVMDQLVLQPCHDDFNNIGAGFGFPPRFRVEASDDPEFRPSRSLIVSRELADVPNPGTAPQKFSAHGASGRFVRVTATRLAPRQNDFMFALAELQVFDSTGHNLAARAAVSALDSIEAPPRWRKNNLTDDIAPAGSSNAPLAELRRQRAELLTKAGDAPTRQQLADTNRELETIAAELKKLPAPSLVYAGTVHHGSGNFAGTGPGGGQPRVIHLLHRGDVRQPRDEVAAAALSAIAGHPGQFALPPDASEGARRAALAQWLASMNNPLTWRSLANRVWQHHFGRGLVETPNDFGRMGARPTHPELLDWLACEFRDRGGSLKQLHKLIVMSATYRQSSAAATDANARGAMANPPGREKLPPFLDSDNHFLSRQNRRKLDAESVRDSVLLVAGRLDPRLGGPAFQDFVIEKPEHSPHYQYRLHDPDDPKSHRRSLYRFIVRSQLQPFMTALDCADPSIQVGRRNETASALQALALLNNGFMVTMARHFAARLEAESGPLEAKMSRAFHEALARAPTAMERAALTACAQEHGLANACRVIFNLNEFVFLD